MKKKNIAWGLFFIFLAAVYLVISSTGMELGVGLPGIFMTVLFVWLFVEGIKDVNFYSIVFAIAFICILYRKPLGLEKLGLTSWTILGAALLLSIGLSMIFKDVRRKNWKTKTINWDEQMSTPNGERAAVNTSAAKIILALPSVISIRSISAMHSLKITLEV